MVALAPGATLLLYTDGLVERRGVHLDDAIHSLAETLFELGQLPPEDLCEALLATLPAENEDDVVLLVLRA